MTDQFGQPVSQRTRRTGHLPASLGRYAVRRKPFYQDC
jgi:hypothetical protein